MKKSPIDIAYDHIIGMQRNYPDWPSTFSPCATEGCSCSGRGGNLCADCHEQALEKIIGKDMAILMHQAIATRHELWLEIRDELKV